MSDFYPTADIIADSMTHFLLEETIAPYPLFACHGLFCLYSHTCERYAARDRTDKYIEQPPLNKYGMCEDKHIDLGFNLKKHLENAAHFRNMWLEGFFHMWRLRWSKEDEQKYGKLKRNNHV